MFEKKIQSSKGIKDNGIVFGRVIQKEKRLHLVLC